MRPQRTVRPTDGPARAQSPSRGLTQRPPDRVLVSHADMAFSPAWGYWRGAVRGGITGKAEFHEQPKNFEKDGKEYYFEKFVIQGRDGVVRGTKDGVYDLTTGDFWDCGRVTEASGRWARLVRYRVFEKATTTKPGVFPLEGHHTPLVLVSSHPGPGGDNLALVSRSDAPLGRERAPARGSLTGDLQGTIERRPLPGNYVIGDVEYFSETCSVTTEDGALQGREEGMYDRVTGAFASCGHVTGAAGALGGLVGRMIITWGQALDRSGEPFRARRHPFVVVRV